MLKTENKILKFNEVDLEIKIGDLYSGGYRFRAELSIDGCVCYLFEKQEYIEKENELEFQLENSKRELSDFNVYVRYRNNKVTTYKIRSFSYGGAVEIALTGNNRDLIQVSVVKL
jgi:hypothetical protein